jgi:hypothetical protein
MPRPKIDSDGRTITVRVPIAIRKRGGRKVVLARNGTPDSAHLVCQGPDNAMIKALARSFRWREMLEQGAHATITELARAERIDHGYVGRILRLTLLAPEIIEAILEGRQPSEISLAPLMRSFPVSWVEQRAVILRRS